MAKLAELIPEPRMLEIDHVDVAASPKEAWQAVRHFDLGRSKLIRALVVLRTGDNEPLTMDDLFSSPAPGFRKLGEEVGATLTVGSIGQVWQRDIPFQAIDDAADYLAFDEEGWIKVAWELRVLPRGAHSRIEIEVRVAPTDEESWRSFRRYFRFIGPGSHFIRRQVLAMLARGLGDPEAAEGERTLPGDELLSDSLGQITDGITIAATPRDIWPWLVQMGCRRGGWYSYDALDNAGVESATEVHPELQHIAIGDVLPATPDSDDGFEVLVLDEPKLMVLGGLFDNEHKRQLPFASSRPERYWHVTWAFVLEPLDKHTTRLIVRGRVAFSKHERLHRAWIGFAHHLMQRAQLRRLRDRVERRQPRDGVRDVVSGIGGAAAIALNLLTPFLRPLRNHWGLDEAAAARDYPGDELIPEPRMLWTHGIEIDAPPDKVWPWIAQIGADRGGFYSYQWLENIVGCEVKNAETIHPEWAVERGDGLSLHPDMPPMPIVVLEPGKHMVAYAAPLEADREAGKPWMAFSWLFFLEPLRNDRTRLISRARSDYSEHVSMRLQAGPFFTESVGFVMDRKMLLGVKERVERRAAEALAHG